MAVMSFMIQAPGANVMNWFVFGAHYGPIPATLLEGRLLALFQNIRQGWKDLPGANALAHFAHS
jgi:hypothetical protein